MRCYIIIDPWGKVVMVRYLEAPGRFGRLEVYTGDDRMPVKIFEGLTLDLARLFKSMNEKD